MAEPLDHLHIAGFSEARPFRSTLSVRKAPVPPRNRATHGARLLQQLVALSRNAEEITRQREEFQLPPHLGMTIALEVSPRGLLDYKQLEWRREGIEVLSVTAAETSDIVALHVPEGRLAAFETRIQDYLTKNTRAGKPANAALIDTIENFRKAAFDELWTDDADPLPAGATPQWFQLWLRQTEAPAATRAQFADLAGRFGIVVEDGFTSFPGRVVVAAYAARAALGQAIELLDRVAEIRSVAPTAEFFLSNLTPAEQVDWVRNLEARMQSADPGQAPYVTLLDTGVNNGHPLLTHGLNAGDMHAINPGWQHTDHHGHGTQMAGLALHGNLSDPLASTAAHFVPHRLESVKILPPIGQNSPHLYGPITMQAAAAVETPHPERRRTFAMMTTAVGNTTGLPSEWSATIDQLAFGTKSAPADGGDANADHAMTPRLFVLSAGNVPWPAWTDYPAINDLSPIESPAQAWNALTVGAYTELTYFDASQWPSLTAIGPAGALSPSSSTSISWRRTWPFKPDVVAEGGNGCLDAGRHVVVGPESLRLLTTSHDMTKALLTESGDTSAATAEAARLCAHLSDRYPGYWPETLRALVVHGARYTRAMREMLPIVPLKRHKETLLRRFGYGAIEGGNSLYSTATRPTLVLEETLTPYRANGANVSLNGVNMHDLPWPAEALQNLGEASVALRVTLSYFIDPNPSQRGWQSKFRYQSHGLRFAVKGATETAARFGQRINKLEREEAAEGDQEGMKDPDIAGWFLGAQLRSLGSVHSDVWIGTAAELAEKSHIAIFPVGGWWKDWKDAGRYTTSVRYALVVTLELLESVDVDLYTPVLTRIQTPIVVEVPG